MCGSRSIGGNFINCVTTQEQKGPVVSWPIRQVMLLLKWVSHLPFPGLRRLSHLLALPTPLSHLTRTESAGGGWTGLHTCISTVGVLPLWEQVGARPLNWLLSLTKLISDLPCRVGEWEEGTPLTN